MQIETKFNLIFELLLLLILKRFDVERIFQSHREFEDIGVTDNLVHESEITILCQNFLKLLLRSLFFSVTCDQIATTCWVNGILHVNCDLALWELDVSVDRLSFANLI